MMELSSSSGEYIFYIGDLSITLKNTFFLSFSMSQFFTRLLVSGATRTQKVAKVYS